MKKLLIAACLVLAGCAGTGGVPNNIPTSPGQIAQHTAVDEIAMKDAEQIYKLSRTIGEALVDAGIIKGANADRAIELDRQMFAALGIARTAYKTFNSNDLLAALTSLRYLSEQVNTLAGGK